MTNLQQDIVSKTLECSARPPRVRFLSLLAAVVVIFTMAGMSRAYGQTVAYYATITCSNGYQFSYNGVTGGVGYSNGCIGITMQSYATITYSQQPLTSTADVLVAATSQADCFEGSATCSADDGEGDAEADMPPDPPLTGVLSSGKHLIQVPIVKTGSVWVATVSTTTQKASASGGFHTSVSYSVSLDSRSAAVNSSLGSTYYYQGGLYPNEPALNVSGPDG
jgi:hypothetical protein